ncbi:carbapenem self-resistance protein CarG family protein [Musicola keenii]|uniref:carbapenem self-resistance protein CarG family protein n=1 Tax=Musicola keenii TaxID=2884250 RepID=UPI00177CFDB5|nr:CpmJ protein [Musicola keenii]
MYQKLFPLVMTLIITISAEVSAQCPTEIKLVPGVNYIDLISHQKKDLAIIAMFDNNTSHPYQGLSFYIHNADSYSIIPVPDSQVFIWFDYSIAASRTKVFDYRLYRFPQGIRLVTALKIGDDPSDRQRIELKRYALMENHEDPGIPPYSWYIDKTAKTEQSYDSADEIFKNTAFFCTVF